MVQQVALERAASMQVVDDLKGQVRVYGGCTQAHRVVLPWPVLNVVKYRKLLELDPRWYANQSFSLNYDPGEGLQSALNRLSDEVSQAVAGGAVVIVLSDRDISPDKLPMHAALATGAVHQRLIRDGLP